MNKENSFFVKIGEPLGEIELNEDGKGFNVILACDTETVNQLITEGKLSHATDGRDTLCFYHKDEEFILVDYYDVFASCGENGVEKLEVSIVAANDDRIYPPVRDLKTDDLTRRITEQIEGCLQKTCSEMLHDMQEEAEKNR